MGWKGYTSSIDPGMLFRKMYCHKCGNQLKKKKISNIYKKGDPNYTEYYPGMNSPIGMDKIERAYYIYHCPNCDSEITYDDQCIIAKKQKQLKKKVLNEND